MSKVSLDLISVAEAIHYASHSDINVICDFLFCLPTDKAREIANVLNSEYGYHIALRNTWVNEA